MSGIASFKNYVSGVLLLGLAACAASGPDVLYGLSSPDTSQFRGKARSQQILVAQPIALQALDTSHIAVSEVGPSYTYYPKVAWSDSLPKVFQANLVAALEDTGGLNGVALPGQGLLIDYQLQTTIRRFEVQTQPKQALVEVAVRLVNDHNGKTVAYRLFRSQVPAKTLAVNDGVDALNAASDQVLLDMTGWVLTRLGA
ncbi:ABC-type transport auxiliary lipoprotein family protein [Polycladidibacter stylochi]|uniref:ABC-type transport auxiliary lipoprotein family protein n=1 Tax=Polycladidibacter stylochi TaxID=1807766 RepID=UPI000837891A|nr:ABC-type transport auxiliary lipoprotein family protein [Pseudovibrio stylochi]